MIVTMLLNGLWQGALIAAIAAFATALLPARHAATRYAVWFAALLALAILPIASLWHPSAALAPLPSPVEHTAAVTSLVTANAASASGSWLLFLWLAGVAFGLLRLGLSYARIDRIVRNATPAPELGAGVVISNDIAVPIAARFFSPAIVIPANLIASLERSDLESIVRHERAHIARLDIAGNFIQRTIEAALFFNPWVYLIGRQLVKERESACDDWAVHAMPEPDRYASCLAQLAQGAQRAHVPLLTPSAIGSRRMLVGRIARLLNGKVSVLKVNYLALGASVLAFGLLTMLVLTPNGRSNAVAIAAASCVVPTNLTAHTPEERAKLRDEYMHTSAAVKPLNPVPPDIPKAAFKPNVGVTALVTVDPNGRPIHATITKSSGSAAIDRATINAAMASTYSPAMNNCKHITGQYLFQINTGLQ